MSAFDEKLVAAGTALAEYCRTGQEEKGLSALYHPDAVSVEAGDFGGPMPRTAEGIDAIRAKHDWWNENMEVTSMAVGGPYFHAPNLFSLTFLGEAKQKSDGQVMPMEEVAIYEIDADGKIVKESFHYSM